MKTILCFGDSNTWGYNPEIDNVSARRSVGQGITKQIR